MYQRYKITPFQRGKSLRKKVLLIVATVLLLTFFLCVGIFLPQSSDAAVESTSTEYGLAAEDTASEAVSDESVLVEDSIVVAESALLDVEWISQLPDLPTGCEITAATMALDYYGYDAENTDLDAYLAKSDDFYYEDGVEFGPDPDQYFIGDTESNSGWFCTPVPVVAALNAYIEDAGGSEEAIDITGATPDELYALVSEGTPVVVWVTTYLQDYEVSETWYSSVDGLLVEASTHDHAMVLIGYDDENVILADPLDSIVAYSKEAFEASYTSRGNMACIIQAV